MNIRRRTLAILLVLLVSAATLLAFQWQWTSRCVACWTKGELKAEGGGFPTAFSNPFPKQCLAAPLVDLEFRISHECNRSLEGLELRLDFDHEFYSGPFSNPLSLKKVHRCRDWKSNVLIVTLTDTEASKQWR